jgi:hypothetical protein
LQPMTCSVVSSQEKFLRARESRSEDVSSCPRFVESKADDRPNRSC